MEKNGTEILASGEVHGPAPAGSLSAWPTLELAFECAEGEDGRAGDFTASINGAVVASGNSNATAGMAALSSGWHIG